MREHFQTCSWQDLGQFTSKYVESLASPIDSFLEDHILDSKHYLICQENEPIGYFSIFQKWLLTQFYLEKPYRKRAQEIFQRIKHIEEVRAAFVPTADEFFLAHAVDDCRLIEKQAYFFQDSGQAQDSAAYLPDLKLRQAQLADLGDIQKFSGDFFDENLEMKIRTNCIYIAEREAEILGFGVIERGRVVTNCASIGMYVREEYRQRGIGRNILLLEKEIVKAEQLQPIAGCWYYNHFSKKTLESAGLQSSTRLMKISY